VLDTSQVACADASESAHHQLGHLPHQACETFCQEAWQAHLPHYFEVPQGSEAAEVLELLCCVALKG
jgi:hypothetical protein